MNQIACTQSRAHSFSRPMFSGRAFFLACALSAAVGCNAADSSEIETDDDSLSFVSQALDGYSLSAPPATLAPGASMSIDFVAPAGHNANDWIGVYPVGGQPYEYIGWSYVGAGETGTVSITLPASAVDGQAYELRYMLVDYTLAANSTSFTAVVPPPDYTFPNGPYTSPAGRYFWCDWQGLANHDTRDWIGLYRVGASQSQYLAYAFVGAAGSTSGSVELMMPADAMPGEMFETRYILSTGKQGGKSDPFAAGNRVSSPTGYIAKNTDIVSSWSAPASHAENDWIGILPVDAESTEVLAWTYVGNAGATSGQATVRLPASAPDGVYEMRYFLAGTYELSGVSTEQFHVGIEPMLTVPVTAVPGAPMSASWQAPANHSATDWIGLYEVGTSSLLTFAYVGSVGQTNGSVNIAIPASASGSYELRYATNNTYNVTATSAQFTVAPQ